MSRRPRRPAPRIRYARPPALRTARARTDRRRHRRTVPVPLPQQLVAAPARTAALRRRPAAGSAATAAQHAHQQRRQTVHGGRGRTGRWRTRPRSPCRPGRPRRADLGHRDGRGRTSPPRPAPESSRCADRSRSQATSPTRRPLRRWLCSTSMTWNSGCRRATRPGQLLHQPLERHVLVGERAQVGRRAPGRAARRNVGSPDSVGAQHQGVDEEPDQVVQRLVGPARDRRCRAGYPCPAPSRVSSTASAGLQHHEQRRALLRASGRSSPACRSAATMTEAARSPRWRRHGRARPVGRQRQLVGAARRARPASTRAARQRARRIVRSPSSSRCQSA